MRVIEELKPYNDELDLMVENHLAAVILDDLDIEAFEKGGRRLNGKYVICDMCVFTAEQKLNENLFISSLQTSGFFASHDILITPPFVKSFNTIGELIECGMKNLDLHERLVKNFSETVTKEFDDFDTKSTRINFVKGFFDLVINDNDPLDNQN